MKIKKIYLLILLILGIFICFLFPFEKEVKKLNLLILCKDRDTLTIYSLQSAYYINNVNYHRFSDTLVIKPYIKPVRGLFDKIDKGFKYSLTEINFVRIDTLVLPVNKINKCYGR